ncbi:hypothetical protein [Spirillospora sp. NPDC047279]|uniref:hypothetical protein n=1 Tax=Spirillospora sp. NPDC047279 TaxID=3155478 RepID=UPI00340B4E4F
MTDAGGSPFSAEQIKHLEFIQAVITRLGNGSFLIKGWALTLLAAFLGFSLRDLDWKLSAVALVPLVGFWLLDSYFLRQERLFRKLYDQARLPGKVEVFSMNVGPYVREVSWFAVVRSSTMAGFYGTLTVVTLILVVVALLK